MGGRKRRDELGWRDGVEIVEMGEEACFPLLEGTFSRNGGRARERKRREALL